MIVNTIVAKKIVDAEVAVLRSSPYRELVNRFNHPEQKTVCGEDGKEYFVAIDVFPDAPAQNENLRVLVAIDDGGLRAFVPMTVDFIMAPDGTFVGE